MATAKLDLPAWRVQLSKSMRRNEALAFSRYMSVATVRADGSPSVRTMVMRGWLDEEPAAAAPVEEGSVAGEGKTEDGPPADAGEEAAAADGAAAPREAVFDYQALSALHRGCTLQVTTDLRSEKCSDMAAQAAVEVCWFMPVTQEQWRLSCFATMVGPDGTDDKLMAARLRAWQRMKDETRATFEWPAPGTTKAAVTEAGDLDRYEPQPIREDVPSTNFGLLLLRPWRVDQLLLPPPPQVSTRRPVSHESVLKARRIIRRWLHILRPSASDDGASVEWQTSTLNP
eukprot:PLAT9129.1.p1 GENE.PLAT9129.1~~PLAT9129.1.p1  ORF type:complete len:310 (+),score=87.80 PLAT9129.1:74-931(+)